MVVARQGESVSTMSRRYGVPASAIASANPGLNERTQLVAGQQVLIPTYVQGATSYANAPARSTPTQQPDMITTGSVGGASAAPRPLAKPGAVRTATPIQPSSTVASAGGYHTVQSGESLSGIAARYGLSSRDLQAANGIEDRNAIRIGQRLRIPAAGSTSVASSAATSQPMPPAITENASTTKPTVVASLPPRKPAPPKAEATPAATQRVAALDPDPVTTGSVRATASDDSDSGSMATGSQAAKGGPSFRWPVRGRVISGFGDKPNGERNDGINLAVPEGTSVKAAEDGVVIYSGNELKGYGNLVLVRHSGGWVTAYGHNSELIVRRGDTVRRGEIIARAGATGTVSQPQVHFELRQGSRPVDPQPYLAGS